MSQPARATSPRRRQQNRGDDDKSSGDETSDSESNSDASNSDLEEGEVASRRRSRKNSENAPQITIKQEKDDRVTADQVSGTVIKEEPDDDADSKVDGGKEQESMEVTEAMPPDQAQGDDVDKTASSSQPNGGTIKASKTSEAADGSGSESDSSRSRSGSENSDSESEAAKGKE